MRPCASVAITASPMLRSVVASAALPRASRSRDSWRSEISWFWEPSRRLMRRVPYLGFHAAAADGADHGAVFPHQQLGALVTGDGSAHLDDGGDGALLTELAQAQEFLVDIHSRCNYSAWWL